MSSYHKRLLKRFKEDPQYRADFEKELARLRAIDVKINQKLNVIEEAEGRING